MSARSEHGAPWTTVELAKLEAMIIENLHPKDIAHHMGRTEGAIRARIGSMKRGEKGPAPRTARRQERRRNGASFFLS